MIFRSIIITAILFASFNVNASDLETVHRSLIDALICNERPADAVIDLVKTGSDFKSGYAAFGFGEGTGYKAVVVLNEPLILYGASTSAVVSETEPSYFGFLAFTYAQFKGDYLQAVKTLNLQPATPLIDTSLGKFVSRQAVANACPNTVALTPLENGFFLLGCGWCNGG